MYRYEITDDYYMWLLDKVDALHGDRANYSLLMQLLYSTKYEYAFVMDSNRAKSGENLRSIFALEEGYYLEDVHQGPCSVLEMLIALADNMAFDTEDTVSRWFWEMLDNLGISNMDDNHYDEEYILSRLFIWMNRQFEPDGTGSIFPLHKPVGDCRRKEIWTLMNAYLMENHPIDNWME